MNHHTKLHKWGDSDKRVFGELGRDKGVRVKVEHGIFGYRMSGRTGRLCGYLACVEAPCSLLPKLQYSAVDGSPIRNPSILRISESLLRLILLALPLSLGLGLPSSSFGRVQGWGEALWHVSETGTGRASLGGLVAGSLTAVGELTPAGGFSATSLILLTFC